MQQPKIDDGGERVGFGEGRAVREPSEGKGRFDLVSPYANRRLARWYELGAGKYSDRNWEKGGIPFSRYLDSAFRHLNKYLMGMTDEDHLAAAAWNIFSIMHFEELGDMQWDDLPHYESGDSSDDKELKKMNDEIIDKLEKENEELKKRLEYILQFDSMRKEIAESLKRTASYPACCSLDPYYSALFKERYYSGGEG